MYILAFRSRLWDLCTLGYHCIDASTHAYSNHVRPHRLSLSSFLRVTRAGIPSTGFAVAISTWYARSPLGVVRGPLDGWALSWSSYAAVMSKERRVRAIMILVSMRASSIPAGRMRSVLLLETCYLGILEDLVGDVEGKFAKYNGWSHCNMGRRELVRPTNA